MSNPRPGLLARKPARRLVHYLDFPGTTGITGMDARIADEVTEPAVEAGRWSTERIIRLEKSFMVYRGPTESAEPNLLPALKSGHVTFGSVNTLPKLSPTTLRLWASVLAAVPGSRLLLAREEFAEAALRQEWQTLLARHGLAAARVDFASEADFRRLEAYHSIDIVLDTTPYNGVTTTGDALWMGVPVVTLLGDRFGARVSASMLTSAGHPEWIAGDAAQYVHVASRLAADLPALAQLRTRLRAHLLASPLGDVASHLQRFEAALFSWVLENEAT
jgi:protein O-GlcNAc transferase